MTTYIAFATKNNIDGTFSLSLVDFPLSVNGISSFEFAKVSLQESLRIFIDFEVSLGSIIPTPTPVEHANVVVSRDKEFYSVVEIEV